MTPKRIHSLVIGRARRGTLMDRCALTVYYIFQWVAVVCSVIPIQSTFFPREYFMATALGFPFVPILLALPILEWLKWRHLYPHLSLFQFLLHCSANRCSGMKVSHRSRPSGVRL